MKVKLLKDVERGNKVKIVARRGRKPIACYAGTVIEVSEATAAKWIAAGVAEEFKHEPA
jgi:hypothetical protein